MQFKYEMKLSEVKMKLQPTTLQEVREQRQTNLKTAMASISTAVVDCGKLLDEILQIWTLLQEDPNVQKLQEQIQQKQQQWEDIRSSAKTLLISQNLAKINEGKALQNKIEELKKEEQFLIERTQPWKDEAIKLL